MSIEEEIELYKRNKEQLKAKKDYPHIFNSWRGFMYAKGKKFGCEPRWKIFMNFFNDMLPTYTVGDILVRKDQSKPFSKENCIWINKEVADNFYRAKVYLEYNGEKHSLEEWANIAGVSAYGVRNRYFKHKDTLTTKEIIYGKIKKRGDKPPRDYRVSSMSARQKASKMLASYRFKDRKNGVQECDISIEWMIDNIFKKECVYCGDTYRLGLDRIDNSKGHTMDNVVPCCYDCNCARNKNFSYEEMKIIGETIKKIKKSQTRWN